MCKIEDELKVVSREREIKIEGKRKKERERERERGRKEEEKEEEKEEKEREKKKEKEKEKEKEKYLSLVICTVIMKLSRSRQCWNKSHRRYTVRGTEDGCSVPTMKCTYGLIFSIGVWKVRKQVTEGHL